MHQAVLVNNSTNPAFVPTCAAGHRFNVASSFGLALRFSVAALLLVAGVSTLGTLAMLPVGWTLISLSAGIVASTFLQHANYLRGVCTDCDDEALAD